MSLVHDITMRWRVCDYPGEKCVLSKCHEVCQLDPKKTPKRRDIRRQANGTRWVAGGEGRIHRHIHSRLKDSMVSRKTTVYVKRQLLVASASSPSHVAIFAPVAVHDVHLRSSLLPIGLFTLFSSLIICLPTNMGGIQYKADTN